MFGCEGELKSAGGLLGQPSPGFPRDMRGMIVSGQRLDRRNAGGRVSRGDWLAADTLFVLARNIGDALHLVATHNTPPVLGEARRRSPPTIRDPLIDRMV